MKGIFLLRLCAILLTWLTVSVAAGEPRTALVMGVVDDGTGKAPRPLPGMAKNLPAISAKLRELGFDVTIVTNPTLAQAEQAVVDFSTRLRVRRGVALFYFTGQGAAVGGTNYLVPKNARISSARDLAKKALSARRVLDCLREGGAAVNLVFLDCFRSSLPGRPGPGLAPMQAPGMFIGGSIIRRKMAEAATEGSPYTRALVEHLATPGLGVADMHTLVDCAVRSVSAEDALFQYSDLDPAWCLQPEGEPANGTAPCWSYDPDLARWIYRDSLKEEGAIDIVSSLEKIPDGPGDSGARGLTLNLFSQASQTNARCFDRVARNGGYVVGGHGNPDFIRDDRGQAKDGAGRKMYPKDLANEIKCDASYYPGRPVTLYACSTGMGANSFAQQLADELGAPVMAPEDVLWSNAHGPTFVGPWKWYDRKAKDYAHERGFKYFYPRQ